MFVDGGLLFVAMCRCWLLVAGCCPLFVVRRSLLLVGLLAVLAVVVRGRLLFLLVDVGLFVVVGCLLYIVCGSSCVDRRLLVAVCCFC